MKFAGEDAGCLKRLIFVDINAKRNWIHDNRRRVFENKAKLINALYKDVSKEKRNK